jgi:Holliday junction resolvase RusA-like endonuclease
MIEIQIPISPVSQQSSRAKKNLIIEAIQSEIKNSSCFFVGDVQVDIQWYIHEQLRYEKDSSADVDNIIKPILDSLCGKKGLMINDCQVQSISCSWIDYHRKDEQKIYIKIQSLLEDLVISTRDITFLKINDIFCFPVGKDIPINWLKIMFVILELQLKLRDKAIQDGIDYYRAKYFQSIQRPFHISRVQDFDILSLEITDFEKSEIIQALKNRMLETIL